MCKISEGVFLVWLMLCSLSDIRTKEIPIVLLIGMSAALFFFRLLSADRSVGAVACGVMIGGVFFLISKMTGEAIGYGDSWIILLLGAYLGGRELVVLLVAAFGGAGIFSLIGFAVKKQSRTWVIPFVPFLTAAYAGVVFL